MCGGGKAGEWRLGTRLTIAAMDITSFKVSWKHKWSLADHLLHSYITIGIGAGGGGGCMGYSWPSKCISHVMQ